MSKLFRRRAFTLPEVLVTVTIVAVLAAVIVPAVINQVAKGDQPAIAQDIAGIRTAIMTFAADTRKFPRELSDLGGSTLNQADLDIDGNTYGADAQTNYRGPYLSLTSGHTNPMGAVFSDLLATVNRAVCMVDSVASGASKITVPQMEAIKLALDNSATATGSGVTAGLVTWDQQGVTGTYTVVPGSVRVCVTSK